MRTLPVKHLPSVLLSILLLLPLASQAECVKPDTPEIPDGSTSDLDAMLAAHQAVTAYIADSDVYMDCLTEEEAANTIAGDADSEKVRAMYNAVVDENEAVAESLNVEIRKFKARPGE